MKTTASALAFALVAAAVPLAWGHGWLKAPPARNAEAGSRNGYCPHCGNGGGVCGDGGQWPSSSNYLGGANSGPQRTYSAGEVVEFEIVLTAHHRGHFELHICDEHLSALTPDPEGPGGCLSRWTLERLRPEEVYNDCIVDDPRDDCQPFDEKHPGRWYLPPGAGSHKMHFRIPQGLQCSSCTLQWRWWTANSCVPANGYGCFFQLMKDLGWNAASWCGSFCGTCLGNTSAGCGEEFRNCADITVIAAGGTPSPSPSTTTEAPSTTQITTTETTTSSEVMPETTTTQAPALTGDCVHNKECSTSAWCNDQSYEGWCAQRSAGNCPSPHCVVNTGAATTTSGPSGLGSCVHNKDCSTSAWCNSPAYEGWCTQRSAAKCPYPHCTVDSGAVTTTLTTTLTHNELSCVHNKDCSISAWCHDAAIEVWCTQQTTDWCSTPHCVLVDGPAPAPTTTTVAAPAQSTTTVVAPWPTTTATPIASATTTVLGPSPTPTPPALTTTTAADPSPEPEPTGECVSQRVLACINDYSTYWPKCDPGQAKSNVGPDGYEFGHYCTQEWTDALNAVLSDPLVDKCGDFEATRKFLAQVAYETGYYSTVYQPRDGGAGLIHMIPQNWPVNAADMDTLWPGHGFAGKVAVMGKDFFQNVQYGWLSVAAWFKETNRVIPGCGKDLFDEPMDGQTRCILSQVVSRQEAYDVVGQCMEKHQSSRDEDLFLSSQQPASRLRGRGHQL